MILVNNQPVGFATLPPGAVVTLREAPPVVYQDGRYVVMTEQRAVGRSLPGGRPGRRPLPAAGHS